MDSTCRAMAQIELDHESEALLGTASNVVPLLASNGSVALELAQRGFIVFPICQWSAGGGWKPIKGWKEAATKDPVKISAWWKKWPDARVGLPTGASNGLTVLDVDVKNGKDGTETLKNMGFSDLSATTPFRARTPSGGWHLMFEHTPSFKNWVGKIGEGLDIKTQGGYIIAPYSLKDGKRYEVKGDHIYRDSKFPTIPAAIIDRAPLRDDNDDLLGTLVTIQKASPWQIERAAEKLEAQAEIVASAPKGQRNATLNSAVFLCAGLAAHGALTEEQVRAALVPAGEACGLARQEISTTFKNAWAGGLKKPAQLPVDCEDEFEDYGDEEVGLPVPAKSKENVSKSFTFEWFHEAELPQASPFLVEDLLDQGTASVVYGPSNAGKTFFTLDLCFALATAHKVATWQGRGIEKTAVLYLALEGGGKFTMRLKALQTAYGDDGKIPFAYRQGGANLLHKDDKGDVKGIVAMAKAMQRDAVAQGLPLMIVIDTLSRALSGGDENAPTDMTAFVGNVDRIREATGAHVMVVHHTGKVIAKGMRGHSSLVAAIDTEIEVIRPDGKNVVQVTVGKQRDHKSDYPFGNFQIKEVTLGTDNRGKEMTSAVADWGVSQERVKAVKFTKPQQLVMDIFQQISGGEPVEREAIISACLGREVSKAKDPKDRRKGVMSILGALVNNNALSESDGLYYIYSPEDDLWFDDLGDEPVGGTGEQGGIQGEHSPSGNASGGGRNGTRSIERSLFPHDVGEGVL